MERGVEQVRRMEAGRPRPASIFYLQAAVPTPAIDADFSAFFRRELEVHQVATKAASLDGTEGDANDHPDSADDPCFPAQIFPEEEADAEARQRRRPNCNYSQGGTGSDPGSGGWIRQCGDDHHNHS